MSKILAVAWREFKQTVMRPIFLLAVFGLPIVFIGIAVAAGFIMATNEQPALVGTLAVIDSTGEVAEAAIEEFDAERIRREAQREAQEAAEQAVDALSSGGAGMSPAAAAPTNTMALRGEVRVAVESATESDDDAVEVLKQRIRDGDLLGVAVVDDNLLVESEPDDESNSKLTFDLFVGEGMDSDHVNLIERRLGKSIVRVRARRAGYEPEQVMAMMREPGANTSRTLAEGGDAREARGERELKRMIPMVFMMLIWIGVLTSAQHLMLSTIEEKSNRVMEVLLSAVSPFQLMTGKILGHGGVGLLIVSIYSSVGVVGLIAAARMNYIDPMDLVYLVVFYLMAYFMIASMMAAVGSAVSDIREANTLVTPVMLIVMIPLMLWLPIIEAPNGSIATVCSFIPPAIPFAMILRLAAEEPIPMWQIPASIAWGYVCVFLMVWGASKIFRVGVLMYGKPPSPLELIKWMRYS